MIINDSLKTLDLNGELPYTVLVLHVELYYLGWLITTENQNLFHTWNLNINIFVDNLILTKLSLFFSLLFKVFPKNNAPIYE